MIGEPFYWILCQQKYQKIFEYLHRYYANKIEENKTQEYENRVASDYEVNKMQEKVLQFVNRIYMTHEQMLSFSFTNLEKKMNYESEV